MNGFRAASMSAFLSTLINRISGQRSERSLGSPYHTRWGVQVPRQRGWRTPLWSCEFHLDTRALSGDLDFSVVGIWTCWWSECMKARRISPVSAMFRLIRESCSSRNQKTLLWYFKRSISWLLGLALACPYFCHRRPTLLGNGYLVMQYVGNAEVRMLSETWDEDRHHKEKRINLYRGLSQILLFMSRTPLPRIGS